jgi:hypothetical protein
VAVRLLARTNSKKPRPLTDEEIAYESGLPISTVQALAELTSWDGVTLEVMRQFMRGCGFDLSNREHMDRHGQYIRKGLLKDMLYLKRCGSWESKYRPLKDKWLRAIRSRNYGESKDG